MSKPITTPINQLPLGEYNIILRHKLIITPDKKFLQMTYSPTSKKITGNLVQLLLLEDSSKKLEEISKKDSLTPEDLVPCPKCFCYDTQLAGGWGRECLKCGHHFDPKTLKEIK